MTHPPQINVALLSLEKGVFDLPSTIDCVVQREPSRATPADTATVSSSPASAAAHCCAARRLGVVRSSAPHQIDPAVTHRLGPRRTALRIACRH